MPELEWQLARLKAQNFEPHEYRGRYLWVRLGPPCYAVLPGMFFRQDDGTYQRDGAPKSGLWYVTNLKAAGVQLRVEQTDVELLPCFANEIPAWNLETESKDLLYARNVDHEEMLQRGTSLVSFRE